MRFFWRDQGMNELPFDARMMVLMTFCLQDFMQYALVLE